MFDFAKHGGDLTSPDALGDAFLLQQGFTLVWLGWEFDVPNEPGMLRAYLPLATNQGKTISGMIHSEWVGEKRDDVISTGDRAQIGYPALDPESPTNRLFVRSAVAAPRTLIPHAEWQFVDSTHVKLNGGFAPGRLYEIVYEAKDPVVAGLGLAGLRDFVSYLKYSGVETPLSVDRAGIDRAIGFGVSQSGRFLREFLYDGFNENELHRKVFDGVWAHVGGAGREVLMSALLNLRATASLSSTFSIPSISRRLTNGILRKERGPRTCYPSFSFRTDLMNTGVVAHRSFIQRPMVRPMWLHRRTRGSIFYRGRSMERFYSAGEGAGAKPR